MGGLGQSGEFGGRNQGDVARTFSPDDNGFLLVYYLVEHGGEVLAETGVRRFGRHGARFHCTGFLYAGFSGIGP